jgi:hypothetical protein
VLDDERLKQGPRIGKDYSDELLERIVGMSLDYAEDQAARNRPMRMADWVDKLDGFLRFNEYEILPDAGRVWAAVAAQLAETHYAAFRVGQDRDYEGDVERDVERLVEHTRTNPDTSEES